jgi:radical SAM superfamily enzyme YgiQ (UPF0313 family)
MPEALSKYSTGIERFSSFLRSRSLPLKPDIMFLNPPLDSYRSNQKQLYKTLPPFGLGILATITKEAGISTNLLDAEAMRLSINEISTIIDRSKPQILGVNITSPTLPIVKRVIAKLKHKPPFILAGGVHPTLMPVHTLAEIPKIDAVFIGESEVPWQKFLDIFKRTNQQISSQHFAEIDGVMSRTAKNIRPSFNSEIDSIPDIDYSFFYNQPYKNGFKEEICILTSRGCTFDCNYCACPVISNRKIRVRSINKIVNEIESFYNKGIKHFHIGDDNFTVSLKRLKEFRDELNNRGINIIWKSFSRTDLINAESIKVMKDSGCYKLSFGIETGTQRVLDSMNKQQNLNDVITAIQLCRESGIESKGFFMLGYPEESEKEINQTITFAKNLGLDSAFFYLVRAYPGTKLYDQLKNKGYTEKELLRYKHIYPQINKLRLTKRQTEIKLELKKTGVFDLSKTLKYNITHDVTISDLSLEKLKKMMTKAYINFYYN